MTPNRSYFYQARYFLLVLIVLSGLVLLATLVWLSHPAIVSANSNDLASVEAKYPNIVGTRLDTCSLCHTAPPTLNAYGAAYLAAGRNPAAFGAIENLDSDGDGWTNIQEIMALTFPGDPNDHPAANTATPTSTATPAPSQTPVATQTSTSVATATSTSVVTATSTSVGLPTSTEEESTRTPYPKVTRTPHPERTPRPTRTPGINPTPTQCSSGREDDSFNNNLDGGLLNMIAMTYYDDACHSRGEGGDD
jgi:hypothetical protein